jgi:hypothetical protein
VASERTVLEVAVANVGFIRATHVLAEIVMWDVAMRLHPDDWPEGEERGDQSERVRLYAEALLLSESAAWRKLARFRKALPGEVDPTRIVLVARARQIDRKVDELAVGSVPFGFTS